MLRKIRVRLCRLLGIRYLTPPWFRRWRAHRRFGRLRCSEPILQSYGDVAASTTTPAKNVLLDLHKITQARHRLRSLIDSHGMCVSDGRWDGESDWYPVLVALERRYVRFVYWQERD